MDDKMIVLDYTDVSARAAWLGGLPAGSPDAIRAVVAVSFPPQGGPEAAREAATRALQRLRDLAGVDPNGAVPPVALSSGWDGGLLVAVSGVMRHISADSARRAALSAGAAVTSVHALDDGLTAHEKQAALRDERVEAVLLAGGVGEGLFEGGSGRQALLAADVTRRGLRGPRRGSAPPLPVIFAGSEELRDDVTDLFKEDVKTGRARLVFADNVRPDMNREASGSAREALLKVFRDATTTQRSVLLPEETRRPTWTYPAGYLLGAVARSLARDGNLLLAEMGRETIEIHSVIAGVANRSVLDSVRHDLAPDSGYAGLGPAPVWRGPDPGRLGRWLPFVAEAGRFLDLAWTRLANPSRTARTPEELFVDHSLLRERLAAALAAHSRVAIELYGLQRQRVGEVFRYVSPSGGDTLVRMEKLRHIYLTGEELAGQVTPAQAALATVDAFQPVGLTVIAVDTRNHLRLAAAGAAAFGRLSFAGAGASQEGDSGRGAPEDIGRVFDWTVVSVAPLSSRLVSPGRPLATVVMKDRTGELARAEVISGEVKYVPVPPAGPLTVTVKPGRDLDFGEGSRRTASVTLPGGAAGLLLDGRGRPLRFISGQARQAARVAGWFRNTAYADWLEEGPR